MKTNPFYTWLPGLMTIVVTVLGFLVFAPEEPTKLFYVNMVYLVLLEGIFFGWFHIGKLKSDSSQTPYFKVFVGVHTMYYLMASLLWLIVYTLLLSTSGHEWLSRVLHWEAITSWPALSLRAYVLVIAILSLVWIVLASIVGSQDTHYHKQQTQLEDTTMDIRAFCDELKSLAAEHSRPETARAWKQLIMEAESIAPKQFASRYAQLREKADKLINS